jgi:hypothetical protein
MKNVNDVYDEIKDWINYGNTSGAQPTSYPMDIGSSLPEDKVARA